MTSLSFTNLRVYVDEKVHNIYTELTNRAIDQAEDIPFVKMPDLFLFSACLGAKNNIYKELGSKRRDIFVADAFDTKIQIPMVIALAYKKVQNLDELLDPKNILNICECWANGGINIAQEQLLTGRGLRPLYRLIDFTMNET